MQYNKSIARKEGSKLKEKSITIRLDEEIHKQIKIRIAQEGLTLKDYILNLVIADLEKNTQK